jgi:histone-lysine N-methyltransferase SETMAR
MIIIKLKNPHMHFFFVREMVSHESIMYDRISIFSLCSIYSPTEIFKILRERDGKNSASMSMIYKWTKKFKEEMKIIPIKKKPGRKKRYDSSFVKNIMDESRNLSLREMERRTHVSRNTIKKIIHEDLGMKKRKKKYVPHILNNSQKRARIIKGRAILKLLKRKNSVIITGDETWIYRKNPTRYCWLYPHEEIEEIERKTISSEKLMMTSFISKNGVEFVDILSKNKNMDSNYFIYNILHPMIEKLKDKYRGNDIFIHFDNAPIHKTEKCTKFIENNNISIVDHPAYSPDIAPCDFFFFGYLKDKLRDRVITSENKLKVELP